MKSPFRGAFFILAIFANVVVFGLKEVEGETEYAFILIIFYLVYIVARLMNTALVGFIKVIYTE